MADKRMPIIFANGARIGPVTIICTTMLLIAIIACFVVLSLYGNPDNTTRLIAPLIPVLTTIGTGFLLYIKAHTVQVTATQQSEKAAEKADEAKTQVETVGAQLDSRLNGELDAKITKAVNAALDAHLSATVIPTTSVAKKAPAKRTTTRKRV